MAYYKIINGIRYDRSLLDAADFHTKGRGEWQISLEEIQNIFQIADDGNTITETEWRTLRYIGQAYTLTTPAKAWLHDKLLGAGESADLEKVIQIVVVGGYGLPEMQFKIAPDEVQRQVNRPGNITDFRTAIGGAMYAFFYQGMNQLSLKPIVRRKTGNGKIEDDTFIHQVMRDLLNQGATLFLVPEDAQQRADFEFDLPGNLDFDLFWHFGLHVPQLSPLLFMSSVSRKTPGFQHSSGYISRRLPLENLIFSVIREFAQFTRLKWEIDPAEVSRQLEMMPGQNFGEALFGALTEGIFNAESSFSFQDFIRQEIWIDPDRNVGDYMREYIETGTLRLLSPGNAAAFEIPENLVPDFNYDWVFGLEMHKKTDARFIITSSRLHGFEASWNDGFLHEKWSLEAQIKKVLEEFKLPTLQIIAPAEEYEAQRTQFGPDYRTFSSLLRQALNTILHDYLKPNSVFNTVVQKHAEDVRADHFDDPLEFRYAVRQLIFEYLKNGSLELLPIELPDNNPVDGEPVQDFWQFFGFLPELSNVGFWVIIPRYPDDEQLPYCYGFE